MKKIFAMLLAVMMVFSLATVAFAEGEETPIDTSTWKADGGAQTLKLSKIYTVTGQSGTGAVIVPDEVLSFTSTADANNPTTQNLEISTLADDAMSDGTTSGTKTGEMTITLPEYSAVGKYNYTIKETAGSAQAANYSTAEIKVQVLVTYDYENSKLATQVTLTSAGTADADDSVNLGDSTTAKWKLDTFKNEYKLGTLNVKKDVTGNLGAKDVEFKMTVKFSSDKDVMSDITITDGSNDEDFVSDTSVAQDWIKNTETGKYEKTATIYVKHGETVTFTNIPEGVSYEVVEDSAHGGTDAKGDDTDAGYTISYTGEKGTISSTTASTATVTNHKESAVDTGIVLDSMPYVLILAVAAIGLVLFTTKKRVQE